MAKATTLDIASQVNDLVGGKKKPNPNQPTPKQLQDFGNWTGSTDTKVMAADLAKRGLLGADQIILSSPNTNDPNSVTNNQGDWKPSAIMSIVANARKYNLRKPEEILANKKVLMNSLDPRIQDAINDPRFHIIHRNFWDVLANSIIPQQWAKVDAQNQNNLAKK